MSKVVGVLLNTKLHELQYNKSTNNARGPNYKLEIFLPNIHIKLPIKYKSKAPINKFRFGDL
jgi:hypothetical protein